MQRCALPAVLGLMSALLALPAPAQPSRNFPATALRGSLTVTQPPQVLLNDRPARLSPGSRIRGQNNLLQMSGAIVGQKLLVHYTLDPYGLVHDVWILTPAEADRRPWPTTPVEARTWQFDAAAQVWIRP